MFTLKQANLEIYDHVSAYIASIDMYLQHVPSHMTVSFVTATWLASQSEHIPRENVCFLLIKK